MQCHLLRSSRTGTLLRTDGDADYVSSSLPLLKEFQFCAIQYAQMLHVHVLVHITSVHTHMYDADLYCMEVCGLFG